jgi:hypothetical protein
MMTYQKQQSTRKFWHVAVLTALASLLLLSASTAHAQGPPQGNGVKHQATLTWAVDAGATGFNVYRSASATGTFALLTPTPVTNLTAPSFIDTTATGTNFWCVTALATISTGPFETACSNVVTGTIPKDPTTAPSGLVLATQ